jgi:hypothetical protein
MALGRGSASGDPHGVGPGRLVERPVNLVSRSWTWNLECRSCSQSHDRGFRTTRRLIVPFGDGGYQVKAPLEAEPRSARGARAKDQMRVNSRNG